MAKAKISKEGKNQKDLFNIQEQLNTAACVPQIREAIKSWRADKVQRHYSNYQRTLKLLVSHRPRFTQRTNISLSLSPTGSNRDIDLSF